MKRRIVSAAVSIALFPAFVAMAADGKRPRIVGLSSIAVRAHDLDKSRHFYGDLLGFQEAFPVDRNHAGVAVYFKVNDRQYIVVVPESKPDEQRFVEYALETDDADGLYAYLKAQGYKAPDEPKNNGPTYDLAFRMADPDDNVFQVMQYTPESLSVKDVGKHITDTRISRRLLHVGLPVSKPETAKFYVDVLGFREFWRAHAPGGDGKVATLANLKVPSGDDYIEWHLSRRPLAALGTAQRSVSHRPGSARHGQGDRGNQGETCVQRLQAGCRKSRWTKSQSPEQFLRSGWHASRIDGRPHRRRDAVADVQRTAVRDFEIKRDL